MNWTSTLASIILFIVFVLSIYFLSNFFTIEPSIPSSQTNFASDKKLKSQETRTYKEKSPFVYTNSHTKFFGPVCYKTKMPFSPCRGSSCAMIPPFDEEIFMI